jgi:hypothetical protein
VVALYMVNLMSSLFTEALPDAVTSFSDGVSRSRHAGYLPWYLFATAVALGFGVAVIALSVRAILMLCYGVADLGGRQFIEGTVVRVRPGAKAGKKIGTYVAIDDGTSDHVRAVEVYNPSVPRAGAKVRVEVTRRLRYVTGLENLGQSQSRVMTTTAASPWPAPTAPSPTAQPEGS